MDSGPVFDSKPKRISWFRRFDGRMVHVSEEEDVPETLSEVGVTLADLKELSTWDRFTAVTGIHVSDLSRGDDLAAQEERPLPESSQRGQ